MKSFFKTTLILLLLICAGSLQLKAQTSPGLPPSQDGLFPWSENQLIEPALLANILDNPNAEKPLIFNIGAVEDIKGARHIGPVSKAANLEKFKKAVDTLSKSSEIIIYCGCCPLTKCPNIQPAFFALKKLGFTDIKVLNLTTNLKTNWINKGYPLAGD